MLDLDSIGEHVVEGGFERRKVGNDRIDSAGDISVRIEESATASVTFSEAMVIHTACRDCRRE